MKAHDAGLKGTLTDNGDGTATFVMDTLNAGDKVSIGGKTYTIAGTADDVKDMLTKADIEKKHQDVTINGKTYKYNAGQAGSNTDPKKDTIEAVGMQKLQKILALMLQ